VALGRDRIASRRRGARRKEVEMGTAELLERGKRVPPRQFTEASGGVIRLGEFHGRRNLVIFLAHPDCIPCEDKLKELATGYRELAAEAAEVLAILPADRERAADLKTRLALPFPLLTDTSGLLGSGPALIVADRFGEVFTLTRPESGHELPAIKAILDWLAFIEVQCPE
jgi:peroxiredoxin